MSLTCLVILGVGLLQSGSETAGVPADVARWREMLQDRQAPLQQSQAALLLLNSREPEAAEVVRHGLRRTDNTEVFLALAAALRTQPEPRFVDELLAALSATRPSVRQAAAETLAILGTPEVIRQLQTVAEDGKAEVSVRQSAAWAMGRSGRKPAFPVLLDLLSSDLPPLRLSAAEALAELTGQTYGADPVRWRGWWEKHKDLTSERWLEMRLAYQAARARRLEADMDRARAQITRLHQQLYARLPVADRLGYIQGLLEQEDAGVRKLAVTWSVELLASADPLGQRALAEGLMRLSFDTALEVQRSAVLALGRLAEQRAFDRLQQLLREGHPLVRAAAARALAIFCRTGTERGPRRNLAVASLQKALDDPAIEVVIEAAEALGGLGVTEASPVLAGLLKHSSPQVRQTAAQALERVSHAPVIDALLEGLEDTSERVRYCLLGALARALAETDLVPDSQRERVQARLEAALRRDSDPSVRSRAATVLGDYAGPSVLPALWRRLQSGEDARVQEKSWTAMVEVISRSENSGVMAQWDKLFAEEKQPLRRVQLLAELQNRWSKQEETLALADQAQEALVQAHLDQGRWGAAFPLVRELIGRSTSEGELDRRLKLLLTVGEQALREGNAVEALRTVQEAQGPLSRRGQLAAEFQRLERQARQN